MLSAPEIVQNGQKLAVNIIMEILDKNLLIVNMWKSFIRM